jgi:hypothetical protein
MLAPTFMDRFQSLSMEFNPMFSGWYVKRKADDGMQKSGFSEIVISEAPVLEHFVEKKLGKMFPSPLPAWNSYIWENQESIAQEDLKINGEKVIDISGKMNADGLLSWDVPKGEWTVVRFGMSPTGTTNSPSAPQGKGFRN